MAKPKTNISIDRRQLIIVLLFVLALYVLLPQLSTFRDSWQLLRHLNTGWVAGAVALVLLTYLFAALTYVLLAFRRLRYHEVVGIQFAATAINRLLPAGIGALGANYAYLRHRRHTATEAATVVAVNNLLGIIGHATIVLVTLALASKYSRHLAAGSEHKIKIALEIIIGIGIIGLVVGLGFRRTRFRRTLTRVISQIGQYKQRPGRLGGALLSSMALTLGNVLCLYSCMLALGVHLPLIVVVLIFTFGLSTGAVTPTPGGLGGFEAGLVAGFVAYNVSGASGLAIALLFRLVSYWLMLLVGTVALIVAQQKHLFDTQKSSASM
jgi:uncharacterized membrane protein YbhN (UPF0104 family)